ncbi:glycoside hydrolase family 47 protein [Viridothelium virens]|uniref:alpha-1,2-Mannosidase n=1 Tax=Viridothelium virens TaxID=1048519 RepID=A0A6A6HEM3_VIRVR|nr:glycoside hydrolase family 47 protein [Viridothelium virens]
MKASTLPLAAAATLIQSSLAAPASQPPSYPSGSGNGSSGGDALADYRAGQVKDAFLTAWDGYFTYAFPNDELHPISNTFSNSFGGWGASAVDAFSTAIVMELPDVIDTILNYIPTINFHQTAGGEEISLFETTIRYLGGILAGHDLLTGPLSQYASNTTAVHALLGKAQELADVLKFAFVTPTGIPHNGLYVENQTIDTSDNNINGIATIGTLVLEWTHLSDLLGDTQYADLSQKAESYLLNPSPATSQPFPGLIGTNVNITSGQFLDASGGWIGGDDSFYEYLLKMYVYDPTRFSSYRDRWIAAADSTIQYLASHPSSRPDLTFVAEFDGKSLIYQSEHLACFDGGNFILGGLVLGEQKYTDFGLALVAGCEDTYNSTLTGIGPEVFQWTVGSANASCSDSENSNCPGVPADQAEFYERAGFYITNSNYILRPEVIESFYYAYRATKDQKYREWAWNAFVNVNTTTRAGSGYAELNNVNAPGGGAKNDFQDSFLFAEVLKYAYLIQRPDAEFQVNDDGKNFFVFNTEAHPFKVVGTTAKAL